jgi:hypothetical protein
MSAMADEVLAVIALILLAHGWLLEKELERRANR